MDRLKKALCDNAFKRAYEDTSEWSGKLYFIIADVLTSAALGHYFENAWLTGVVFLVILLAGFLFFLGRAPLHQRNELREGLAEKQRLIDDFNTPSLACRFGFISFSVYPREKQVLVISNISVRNSGIQTKAGEFSLSVFIDNVEYRTRNYTPSKDLIISDALQIRVKDLLLKCPTEFSPRETELIPQGGSVNGWVLGLLDSEAAFNLFNKIRSGEHHEIRYSLYFQDVQGTVTRTEKLFDAFVEQAID